MSRILTITPNTLLDFIAVDQRDRDRSRTVTRVDAFRTIAGGKGVNVGRVLARHGHEVAAVGFAGGQTGEMVRELIRTDGMVPVLVETRARTRVAFECIDPSGVTAVLEDGFSVTATELDDFVQAIRDQSRSMDLVILGGSMPSDSCQDLIVRVLEICALQKVPCWVDSYGEAMQRALCCAHPPALVKPNLEEFGNGSGFDFCSEVHVTQGPGAVAVRSANGTFRVTPAKVVEKNAIGSGDCYVAALAHARLSGMTIEEQLRYAAAAGTANAALGANTLIGPKDVESFLAQTSVLRLS